MTWQYSMTQEPSGRGGLCHDMHEQSVMAEKRSRGITVDESVFLKVAHLQTKDPRIGNADAHWGRPNPIAPALLACSHNPLLLTSPLRYQHFHSLPWRVPTSPPRLLCNHHQHTISKIRRKPLARPTSPHPRSRNGPSSSHPISPQQLSATPFPLKTGLS